MIVLSIRTLDLLIGHDYICWFHQIILLMYIWMQQISSCPINQFPKILLLMHVCIWMGAFRRIDITFMNDQYCNIGLTQCFSSCLLPVVATWCGHFQILLPINATHELHVCVIVYCMNKTLGWIWIRIITIYRFF